MKLYLRFNFLYSQLLNLQQQLTTANIYLMLMRRMHERGTAFMQTESQRVTQLLAGKIATSKRTELRLRLNILEAFRSPHSKANDSIDRREEL